MKEKKGGKSVCMHVHESDMLVSSRHFRCIKIEAPPGRSVQKPLVQCSPKPHLVAGRLPVGELYGRLPVGELYMRQPPPELEAGLLIRLAAPSST